MFVRLLCFIFCLCSLSVAQVNLELYRARDDLRPSGKLFSCEANLGLASSAEAGVGIRAQLHAGPILFGVGAGVPVLLSLLEAEKLRIDPLLFFGFRIDQQQLLMGVSAQQLYRIAPRPGLTEPVGVVAFSYRYDLGAPLQWAYSIGLSALYTGRIVEDRDHNGYRRTGYFDPFFEQSYLKSIQPNLALHYEF